MKIKPHSYILIAAIIKCSESFENFIILRKRTYILDALLSKTISLKLFFLSSTLWKGKEGQRRGETSIFENLQ